MRSTGRNWIHDEKKISCRNPRTRSRMLRGEEADIKMIVHPIDAIENVR